MYNFSRRKGENKAKRRKKAKKRKKARRLKKARSFVLWFLFFPIFSINNLKRLFSNSSFFFLLNGNLIKKKLSSKCLVQSTFFNPRLFNSQLRWGHSSLQNDMWQSFFESVKLSSLLFALNMTCFLIHKAGAHLVWQTTKFALGFIRWRRQSGDLKLMII